MSTPVRDLLQGLLLWGALALTWLAYAPGLAGIFVFDDFSNLHGLESLHADPSLYGWLQYCLNGVSSVLGRPLSLATFAFQHASWDAHYADFARVNVLLHLLNGTLWYWLLHRLQRVGVLPAAPWLAAAGCALWLLLPIHAASVLYAVQRMTLLSASLSLAGLLLFACGRDQAERGLRRGYWLAAAGVGVAAVLGTLAKEPAALVPALMLALEATVLRARPRPRHWRAWCAMFLWLPSALLAGYIALNLPQFLAQYAGRDFTLAERLMTEGRVLWLYLGKAFVPTAPSLRLLYDDLAISVGPLTPLTTLPALLAWAAAIAGAWRWRASRPILALGIAWYLVGHVLESTVLPLELAFDHRSYFPLLGPALALVATLAQWTGASRRRAMVGLGGGFAYLAILAGSLFVTSALWGKPLDQARYWVEHQPASRRAIYHYADQLVAHREWATVVRLHVASSAAAPDDPIPMLSLLGLSCRNAALQPDVPDLQRRLLVDDGSDRVRIVATVEGIVDRFVEGQCPQLPASTLLAVLDAAIAAPALAPVRGSLYRASAFVLDATGDTAAALERIESSLAVDPQVPVVQYAVLWSLREGDVARARRNAERLATDPRIPAHARWIYRAEIQGTHQLIELYESLPDEPPA